MEVAHPTIELNRLEEEFSSAQHFYISILWIMAARKFGRTDRETSTSTYMLWMER
jgi:hypothetical protein